MPSKKTESVKAAMAALPQIPKELIDQLVTGPMNAKAVSLASAAFKKALIERALGAELSHHLDSPGAQKPQEASNHRNGASAKTVLTEDGAMGAHHERPSDRLRFLQHADPLGVAQSFSRARLLRNVPRHRTG